MKRSKESKKEHSLSKTLAGAAKLFGAAAVLSTLIPYRITTDEETGEKKYRAIFWEATRPQDDGENGGKPVVHVGFFSPLEDEEAHMYADDLSVDYTDDDGNEPEDAAAEEEAEAGEQEKPEEAADNEEIEEIEDAGDVEGVEDAEEEPAEEAAEPQAEEETEEITEEE